MNVKLANQLKTYIKHSIINILRAGVEYIIHIKILDKLLQNIAECVMGVNNLE